MLATYMSASDIFVGIGTATEEKIRLVHCSEGNAYCS